MLWKLLRKVVAQGSSHSSRRSFSRSSFHPEELHGKLGIVGVPFGKGQKKKGKEEAGLKMAPETLRNTGFCDILKRIGVDISDYGNILYEPECNVSYPNMHNLDHVAPCARKVSRMVEDILRDSRSCLVLGGDHSVAVGSINAHLSVADPKKVAVIYVDAHADINTYSTSPSGNLHGMTVALLARELQEHWPESGVPGMSWLSPSLCLKNVAYIGMRSVDSGEVKYLCQNDVAVFSMEDVTRDGINTVLCKALERIDPLKSKSIHVSFDIDALDYSEAPCTTAPGTDLEKMNCGKVVLSTRQVSVAEGEEPILDLKEIFVVFSVRGGLLLREGIEIAEFLHQTRRLSVVDLVEVSPALGNEFQRQLTLDAAKHIILSLYGYSRRGNIRKVKQE